MSDSKVAAIEAAPGGMEGYQFMAYALIEMVADDHGEHAAVSLLMSVVNSYLFNQMGKSPEEVAQLIHSYADSIPEAWEKAKARQQ